MAGKLILTTVGTSAFEGPKLKRIGLTNSYQKLKNYFRHFSDDHLPKWIENKTTFRQADAFITAYVERLLQKYDIASEVEKPAKGGDNVFSAELTSLHLMYQDSELDLNPEEDRIIFLLSESVEGVLSGLINERLLVKGKYLQGQGLTPELTLVPGLQIDNFERFFSEGFSAFVDYIKNATNNADAESTILNITGGYKALVIYSSYLSLAYDLSIVFAFEELPKIVRIPPKMVALSLEQRDQLIGRLQEEADSNAQGKVDPTDGS